MADEDIDAFIISKKAQISSKRFDRAVEKLSDYPKVLGLDCWWDTVPGDSAEEKPTLLQLAKPDGYCTLFRLNALECVPQQVVEILEDPTIIKVGLDPRCDALKLYHHFKVKSRGVLDIRFLARKKGLNSETLADLANAVLALKLKEISKSEQEWIDDKNLYAANHGAEIFRQLNKQIITTKWAEECEKWNDEEYHNVTVNLWKKYFGRRFQMK